MKATDLLRNQHEEAKRLLEALSWAEGAFRVPARTQLTLALRGHMAVEEELLYPRLEDKDEYEDMVSDFFREHEEIRTAIAELERCEVDDPEFEDLTDELQEILLHHFGEEESELFARIESTFTSEIQDELGSAILARYSELGTGERLGL